MCKQTRWATFRFPPFVSTECSVQERHQKCTKRLDAAKEMGKQCGASKCFYASKGEFVQQILIGVAVFFGMREGKRTKPSIL